MTEEVFPMHMILRYPSGRRVDGILLAAGVDRLRLVVRRLNETMELRLTEGQWTSERGDRIEVEGWIAAGNAGMLDFLAFPASQRVSTATH
jgi:hypothetical protein